jgi:hypothetical protein
MRKGMIRKETILCGVNDKTGSREETTISDLLETYENGGV